MSKRDLVRSVIGFLIYVFLSPLLLFLFAGTWNWSMAWVYAVLVVGSTLLSRLGIMLSNPDLLKERGKYARVEGAQPGDRLLTGIIVLIGPAAAVIIAGLDQRYGWTVLIPSWEQYLAAGIIALCYGFASWAMIVNKYFSAVARIQKDRGQQVITTGPYRLVRHPSYGGALVAALALPFMLDAIWAMIPSLFVVIALIIRTQREDRMLMDGLAGYPDYAQRTRYRLIPGLW